MFVFRQETLQHQALEDVHGLFQLSAHRCHRWWEGLLLSWRCVWCWNPLDNPERLSPAKPVLLLRGISWICVFMASNKVHTCYKGIFVLRFSKHCTCDCAQVWCRVQVTSRVQAKSQIRLEIFVYMWRASFINSFWTFSLIFILVYYTNGQLQDV